MDNIEATKPKAIDGELVEIEILEIEDDLDTGMHRVNVCKPGGFVD